MDGIVWLYLAQVLVVALLGVLLAAIRRQSHRQCSKAGGCGDVKNQAVFSSVIALLMTSACVSTKPAALKTAQAICLESFRHSLIG
jgi:hypothetical protein